MQKATQGFSIKKRHLTVEMQAGYLGAVIYCKLDLPIETVWEFEDVFFGRTNSAAYKKCVEWFTANVLEGWNLQDENGERIPCDPSGMASLPPPLVHEIIMSWYRATQEPPAPLSTPSLNGKSSVESEEMTAPLSKSLVS